MDPERLAVLRQAVDMINGEISSSLSEGLTDMATAEDATQGLQIRADPARLIGPLSVAVLVLADLVVELGGGAMLDGEQEA